jgi:malate dehydrogenase (oxaloacetate-decarboxylating)(NADP+)
MTAKTARMFGVEPVIANGSFSTFDLPPMKMPKSKREAVAYLHEHHPDMIVDGEVQGLCLNQEMLEEKFSFEISR